MGEQIAVDTLFRPIVATVLARRRDGSLVVRANGQTMVVMDWKRIPQPTSTQTTEEFTYREVAR
jgi:hypothetical protein